MNRPTFCSGLADVAARYDGMIVDQWGVLHDGKTAYPEAIACLRELHLAGKRIVLLSNSGRTLAQNAAVLEKMGFDRTLFDAAVTSGEATRRALLERTDPFFADLGAQCVLWSEGGDRAIVEGLPVTVVDAIEDAAFILLSGTDADATLADFEPALQQALARGLPLVCANPDIVVVGPQGTEMAPGTIARHYAALGGRVGYTGKPHPPIYRVCFDALSGLERRRILAIGDSVAHDVVGGAGVGLDTALVMGGIHAEAFDLDRGASANWPALERLTRETGVLPRWVLPRFRWRDGCAGR